ncbi:MAG: heavy-metal-associated domain-containing protein [Gemmatimonadaceae bacterium]
MIRIALATAVAACRPEGDPWGDNAGATAAESSGATTTASPVALPARAADTVLAAGLVKATFDVKGMTCGGCVLGTRRALAKLPGVRTADASYDDKTGKGLAWAVYDSAQVTPEQMMAAIRQLGYVPTKIGG